MHFPHTEWLNVEPNCDKYAKALRFDDGRNTLFIPQGILMPRS